MKRIFKYAFVILLCFAKTIYPQQNNFMHFTTEDGLSQSSVFSIVQDKVGFMWFATEDGLNKFDGRKFTVYRTKQNDSTSIPDLGIRKVYLDKSNRLWVLTLRGKLCKYDQTKNNFKHYSFPLDQTGNQSKIIVITEDVYNKLWVVSTKGDFFFYNPEQDKFIKFAIDRRTEDKLKTYHFQSILGSKDSTFWIGTWEGLINFNPRTKTFKSFTYSSVTSNSIGGNMVFALAEDDKKNIWIGCANGGLAVFNRSTEEFKIYNVENNIKPSISSNRIMSLLIDRNQKVWIGTFDKGLDLFDPVSETFINFSHNPSIPNSLSIGAVMSIFEDKSGGVWIGTGGGSINRFDKLNQNFYHYQHIPGEITSISPNPVLAILEDHLGNLWIGTDGGGVCVKEKKSSVFKSYLQNPAYGSNSITAIYEDKKNNIWLGSDPGAHSPGGAVIKFNHNTKTFEFVKEIKIKLGGVSAILEDKFGDIWFTTPSDGLHRYNPESKKEIVYKTINGDSASISGNSLFNICEDSFGNIWVGSISTGLNLFNREYNSFRRFVNDPKDKNSLSSNSIWCIVEDKNKDIWIGTWGYGLNKFDQNSQSFTRYTVEDGLTGNVIYSIIPDDEGNLWIGSNNGLSKFNPSNKSVKSFNKSNGLLITDFSAGALFKSKEGRLFFGGSSGAVTFNPKDIVENTYLPNVIITEFKVFDEVLSFDKPVWLKDQIELEYDQNFFTIEFASLDYTASAKNIFEYKLEGVDKDWVKAGTRNFANYTDITNGNYKFRLKGSNSSGIFNPKEVVLSIIIAPPFWKTWWFRLLALILFMLLLYSIHKYRLNKLLEVERTRIKIARDLHDEVSASITGIVYFADAVKSEVKEKETPALKKLIGLISESATQIQESMSDIIWSINPDNDDWNIVLPKLRRYASDLCESKNINYNISIPENINSKTLRMDQRHDFWMIFKEIVTNAVKHSNCDYLSVLINIADDTLMLEVSDNGKGFDASVPSQNNGLKNIHSRVKALGGKDELITSLGKGTTWKIFIPIITKKIILKSE